MLKLVFVILHYQNIIDTINCIESIEKLNKSEKINIKIIVVDNNSPNNSGMELKNKYINNSLVDIILLDKNYGFSIANNKGYIQALKYNPDMVLVINNDIIFYDENFLIKLEDKYGSKNEFDIICPDIINLEGNHQNPVREKEMTIIQAYKSIIYESISFILFSIPILRGFVKKIKNQKEKKWFEKYYCVNKNINKEDFVPFGAFIIYANNWLKNEGKAFISDTFMYAEEDMLSLYIKSKKYKIIYDEDLKIKHLEGQSTKKSNKNEYASIKFKSKNKVKALKKYIIYYNNINKKGK